MSTVTGPDLLSQVVPQYRCGQVWGTKCRAMVGPPDYSHGSHGIFSPSDLSTVPDPDHVWELAGRQLSPQQCSKLAANPRISLATLYEMMENPDDIGLYAAAGLTERLHRRDIITNAGPIQILPMGDSWDNWLGLIRRWPNQGASPAAVLSAMGLRHPDKTWQLMLDEPDLGRWAPAVSISGLDPLSIRAIIPLVLQLAHRDRWEPQVEARIWRIADLRRARRAAIPYLSHVLCYGAPEVIYDAVRVLQPQDAQLIPDLWTALQRHPNASTVRAVALGLGVLVPPEQQSECARRLWDEAASSLPSTAAARDAICQIVRSLPEAPSDVRWMACKAVIGNSSTDYSFISNVNWTPEMCEMAYIDPILDHHPQLRVQIMAKSQCPPHILDQETRSRRQQAVWTAALNPNCPADAVLRVLARSNCPSNVRKRLFSHPNLPEQYRQLADMVQ